VASMPQDRSFIVLIVDRYRLNAFLRNQSPPRGLLFPETFGRIGMPSVSPRGRTVNLPCGPAFPCGAVFLTFGAAICDGLIAILISLPVASRPPQIVSLPGRSLLLAFCPSSVSSVLYFLP